MVNGVLDVIGGTSAVAPLMAALIAVINANNSKSSGFLHPVIYPRVDAFAAITQGTNGSYAAAQGWSAATGIGRPDGAALQELLK
jgi:kumamolisin